MPKDRVCVVLGNVNRAPNAWPRVKDRLRLGWRVILEADLKPRRLRVRSNCLTDGFDSVCHVLVMLAGIGAAPTADAAATSKQQGQLEWYDFRLSSRTQEECHAGALSIHELLAKRQPGGKPDALLAICTGSGWVLIRPEI